MINIQPNVRFAGIFKLENGFNPSPEIHGPSLPINEDTLNIAYGGRRRGYVSTVTKLAEAVRKKLPDNVLVQLAIGPWGGNSAYDDVTISCLTPDKQKILRQDRFYRSINEYDDPLYPAMFIPKIIRDNLFTHKIMSRARKLVRYVNKHPDLKPFDPQQMSTDKIGDYVGLW